MDKGITKNFHNDGKIIISNAWKNGLFEHLQSTASKVQSTTAHCTTRFSVYGTNHTVIVGLSVFKIGLRSIIDENCMFRLLKIRPSYIIIEK